MTEPAPRHSLPLACTAAFGFLWVLARACVQSMTIDESDTFLASVLRPSPSHWDATANNHVLNSALMRLFTMVFGASPLTLRLPALIGAALYIAAVYFLVGLITERKLLQWSLFVCLVFNPLVMDYLVAARGYSMALAFLACALTLAARHAAHEAAQEDPAALYKTAALVSACMALSVSANFSFAVADGMTMLAIAIWIGRNRAAQWVKTLAAFVLPGMAIGYAIVGPTVLRWHKSEFTWGAKSLGTTGRLLLEASLFEPNPYLLNPRLHHYFVHFGRWLYPLLGLFFVWRLAVLCWERPPVRGSALALVSAAALLLTLAGHQFLYSVYGILLPLDRTALFLALLILVMVGAVAAIPAPSRMGRLAGGGMTVALALVACYSIGCLRLTYFREWKYDADIKRVYSVLAYYNRTYGMTGVSANWRYVASLNCYREMSGSETIKQIEAAPPVVNEYPDGFQTYVIYYPWDWEFAKRKGLKVVYRDDFTNVAVAIRPELETGRTVAGPEPVR